MPRYTQDHQPLSITTPLGKDAALLVRLTGREALCELFSFQLALLAERPLEFERLVGSEAKVELTLPGGTKRPFHGILANLVQGDRVVGPDGHAAFIRYDAELVPKFWLWTQRVRSRVFQRQTAPEILRQVLIGLDVVWHLHDRYPVRNYCVQYRESDFAFACRLMEEEGIFWFFTHSENGHVLVIADQPGFHPDLSDLGGPGQLDYSERDDPAEPRVRAWRKRQGVGTGVVRLVDQHFQLPERFIEGRRSVLDRVQIGAVSHSLQLAGHHEREVRRQPGGFAKYFDGIDPGGGEQPGDLRKVFEENARLARIHLEREQAQAVVIEGRTDYRHLAPGHKFTLAHHFDADGDYRLNWVEHEASIEGSYETGQAKPMRYVARFGCLPLAIPYRPPARTPRPVVAGTQLAYVTGPPGESIHTDKWGRVKLRFPWDVDGSDDANSSCWVRVCQAWAGQGYGYLALPRVGQGVLVEFVDGDPDCPVVVGSLYDSRNPPPYKLPDHATHHGIKTRSKLGDPSNFNELRFVDTLGKEGLHLHAERNAYHSAENSFFVKVGSVPGSGAGGGDSEDSDDDNQVFKLEAPQGIEFIYGESFEMVGGLATDIVLGGNLEIVAGLASADVTVVPINSELLIAINYEIALGPQNELVVGNYWEMVVGNYDEFVVGNFLEVVTGSFKEYVLGIFLEVVGGDFIETVKGDFAETVLGNFDEVVMGNFTEVLMGDFIEDRRGEYVEMHNGPHEEVDVNKTKSVEGDYNILVGQDLSIECLGNILMIGAESVTIRCGATTTISLTPAGLEINGLNVNILAELQAKYTSLSSAVEVQAQCIQAIGELVL